MLVIRRRAGESLWIGDSIEIEVLETGSARVKLGIKAPKEIAVLRNEVRQTEDQNRTAALEISLDLLAPVASRLGHKT